MGEDELVRRAELNCTRCGDVVDACTICRLAFLADHVVLCRLEHGHAHATCATAKMRKLPERTSSAPPPSGGRRK